MELGTGDPTQGWSAHHASTPPRRPWEPELPSPAPEFSPRAGEQHTAGTAERHHGTGGAAALCLSSGGEVSRRGFSLAQDGMALRGTCGPWMWLLRRLAASLLLYTWRLWHAWGVAGGCALVSWGGRELGHTADGLAGGFACGWSSSSSRCRRLRASSRVVNRCRGTLGLVWPRGTAFAGWGSGSAIAPTAMLTLWAWSSLCM
jgi:hypothetical protein